MSSKPSPLRFLGVVATRLIPFLMLLIPLFWFLGSTAWGATLHAETNRLWARSTAWWMRLLGYDCVSEGQRIVGPLASMEVVDQCNGLATVALLFAGGACMPVERRRLWIGYLVALGIVAFMNQSRLVALTWIASFRPEEFDAYEGTYLRAASWILAVGLFLVWARMNIRMTMPEEPA